MPRLRSFKGYAKVAPYVPFDFSCNLVNLDGYAAGAGWLQIHDLAAAPTAGLEPLKSIPIAAAGAIPSLLSSLGPISLVNGLVIAMSSTENTYTALATSFDAWGEIGEFEEVVAGLTTIGDLTTGRTFLLVWSQLNGPKKIYSFDYVNNNAYTTYLQLYAHNIPGAIPDPNFFMCFPVLTGATLHGNFGPDGYSPKILYLGVLYTGCTIIESISPTIYDPTLATASYIRAKYKNL